MTGTSLVVGIVGAGTMGAGIAQVTAAGGHRTLIFDVEPGRAVAAHDDVAAALARLVQKGRMTAPEAAAARDRLTPVVALADLAPCGLVVEAIVESLDAKRAVFGEVARVLAPGAILATNTSSISVDAIARAVPEPGRVVGMHFFNPAPVMGLVEVVVGNETDPPVVDRVVKLAESWGKVAVRVRSTPGFVVNRVARPFYGEAHRVLEEGATDAATIDAVMREAGGFRMGPLELTDLIGQDVNLAVSQSVWEATAYDPRYAPSSYQRALVEAGRLGRKTGRGIYSYGAGAGQDVPAPRTAEPTRPPAWVRAGPRIGLLADLVQRARTNGVAVEDLDEATVRHEEEDLEAALDFPTATARLSSGLAATGWPEEKPVVMLDLALDYGGATRIAVAPGADCPSDALADVVGFLQAAGLAVSVVADTPGLIVMRTVARLVNEAADLVGRGIASAADIDLAMRYGANYPIGPLEWGDRLGSALVSLTLDNLEDFYRDGRYRPGPFLRLSARSEQSLRTAGAQDSPASGGGGIRA